MYEGYAMGAKMQTHQLGELGGVLKLMFWRMGVEVVIVPPLVLRKLFVPNPARAHPKAPRKVKARIKAENKMLMPLAMAELFGLDIPQSDEADAAALLFAGELRFAPSLHRIELPLQGIRNCEILRPRIATAGKLISESG